MKGPFAPRLDRELSAWFEAEAMGPVPGDPRDRVVAAIAGRRQRPGWLAALHDGWSRRRVAMSTLGQPGGRLPIGTLLPASGVGWVVLGILLVTAVALVAGAILLTRPAGRPFVYADDRALVIVDPGGQRTTLGLQEPPVSFADPRWSPSGEYVSAFVKGEAELQVFDVSDGLRVGDTHGVVDYRWVTSPTTGADAVLIRRGSVVGFMTPDLEPLLTLDLGDATGTLDTTADGRLVAIAVGPAVETVRIDGVSPPTVVLPVTQDSVRQLAVSPDGRWVAVLTSDCTGSCAGTLRLVSANGSDARVLSETVWSASRLAWRADGSALLATEWVAGSPPRPVVVPLAGAAMAIDTGAIPRAPPIIGLAASWDESGDGYVLSVTRSDGDGATTEAWMLAPDGAGKLMEGRTNGFALGPTP